MKTQLFQECRIVLAAMGLVLIFLPACSLANTKKTNHFEFTFLDLASRHQDSSLCYKIPKNSVTRSVGILSDNLMSRVPQYARYQRASCILAVAKISGNKSICEELRPFGSEGVEACLREADTRPSWTPSLGDAELTLRFLGYQDQSLYEKGIVKRGQQPEKWDDYSTLYRELGKKLFPYPKRLPIETFPDFSKGDKHAARQVYRKFPECEDMSNQTRQCRILRCGLIRNENERSNKCSTIWFEPFEVKN